MVEEGFWPGGMPAYGFKLVPALSHRSRSHLALDECVTHWVVHIYNLYMFGDGKQPPMGVRAIARWLNNQGHRTREGARWSNQAIHRILTNPAYHGDYRWNLDPTDHEGIDFGEPMVIKVPGIITKELFNSVQETLKARDPDMGATKADSSPLLLSKLAVCKCGASMTLGTGTSERTKKVYRYYRCSADNRGLDRCSGPWIGEETLNQAVLSAVLNQVLTEDHLNQALKALQEREVARRAARQINVPGLHIRVEAAQKALKGLLEVAKFVPDLQNEPILRSELDAVRRELDISRSLLTEAMGPTEELALTSERLAQFAAQIREMLQGDSLGAAKVYLTTILSSVVVGEKFIRILGQWDELMTAANRSGPDGASPNTFPSGVQRFERRWRRGWDSNPRGPFEPYSLSRGAPSTTRPPLRCVAG